MENENENSNRKTVLAVIVLCLMIIAGAVVYYLVDKKIIWDLASKSNSEITFPQPTPDPSDPLIIDLPSEPVAEEMQVTNGKENPEQSSTAKPEVPPTPPADPVSNFEMVFVKGGSFTMGCTREQGNSCRDNEKPSHRVTVGGFYIGKYEVTQAQWKAVMGNDNNPSHFKGDNLPVENVSWVDVQNFIGKLNKQTGKQYRLPTEAEWEFAARGGSGSKGFKYSGSNTAGNVAWYDNNGNGKTHAVGSKSPNELGIYDMSGNVFEWCKDWYGTYSDKAQTNPQGPSSGAARVTRGGSWNFDADRVRVSLRSSPTPDVRANDLGFRLASNSK